MNIKYNYNIFLYSNLYYICGEKKSNIYILIKTIYIVNNTYIALSTIRKVPDETNTCQRTNLTKYCTSLDLDKTLIYIHTQHTIYIYIK